MSTTTRTARKGDVVIVIETTSHALMNGPTARGTIYKAAVVGSATRDGVVKTLRIPGYVSQVDDEGNVSADVRPAPMHSMKEVRTLPPHISPRAVMLAYRERTWPGHPESIQGWTTLESVRADVAGTSTRS